MKFRTELILEKGKFNLQYSDKILMLGSCFAEHIGEKMSALKYDTVINPMGIIYHPYPIHSSIIKALDGKMYEQEDFIKNIDGQFITWDSHSRLATTELSTSLKAINDGMSVLGQRLKVVNYLVISYGSAYVYHRDDYGYVANCHKFPAIQFTKELSKLDALRISMDDMISKVLSINPDIKILLTVSPVRHIKDGIIENNRSKAQLISMVHDTCDEYSQCYYLPSYELLLDDLRDYRFYNDDLVHPSSQAIDYIWSKVSEHVLDKNEEVTRKEIFKILSASNHRPVNPDAEQYQDFCKKQIENIGKISSIYPNMDFEKELRYFKKHVN